MEIISNLKSFDKPENSFVTIGTFDGVHLGHHEIISKIVSESRESNGKSILVTFWPHPRFIIKKDVNSLKLITTFEEKCELLEKLGIDYLIKLSFTEEFSSLTAEEFLAQILIDQVGVNKLFIGYDHRFGNNREGNLEFLKAKTSSYGYEVKEIPRKDIDHMGVSSTKIRNAILDGDMKLAATLLGRNFSLKGKVIDGNKKGRSIGFPTANIFVEEEFKILPKDGVYAVEVSVGGGLFKGMLNIGFKPTINGSKRTIEVHIFEFNKDIYEEFITLYFVDFVRDEMRFENLISLKNQLEKDRDTIKNVLS